MEDKNSPFTLAIYFKMIEAFTKMEKPDFSQFTKKDIIAVFCCEIFIDNKFNESWLETFNRLLGRFDRKINIVQKSEFPASQRQTESPVAFLELYNYANGETKKFVIVPSDDPFKYFQ